MKDHFHLILPSNSSANIFPNNTTTHFNTYLPHQIDLDGQWSFALTEIQIPYTFQHFQLDPNDRFLFLHTGSMFVTGYAQPGVYKSIEDLLIEINTIHHEHVEFGLTCGGYVHVKRTCECNDLHTLKMSDNLRKIQHPKKHIKKVKLCSTIFFGFLRDLNDDHQKIHKMRGDSKYMKFKFEIYAA